MFFGGSNSQTTILRSIGSKETKMFFRELAITASLITLSESKEHVHRRCLHSQTGEHRKRVFKATNVGKDGSRRICLQSDSSGSWSASWRSLLVAMTPVVTVNINVHEEQSKSQSKSLPYADSRDLAKTWFCGDDESLVSPGDASWSLTKKKSEATAATRTWRIK